MSSESLSTRELKKAKKEAERKAAESANSSLSNSSADDSRKRKAEVNNHSPTQTQSQDTGNTLSSNKTANSAFDEILGMANLIPKIPINDKGRTGSSLPIRILPSGPPPMGLGMTGNVDNNATVNPTGTNADDDNDINLNNSNKEDFINAVKHYLKGPDLSEVVNSLVTPELLATLIARAKTNEL